MVHLGSPSCPTKAGLLDPEASLGYLLRASSAHHSVCLPCKTLQPPGLGTSAAHPQAGPHHWACSQPLLILQRPRQACAMSYLPHCWGPEGNQPALPHRPAGISGGEMQRGEGRIECSFPGCQLCGLEHPTPPFWVPLSLRPDDHFWPDYWRMSRTDGKPLRQL